jgi:putative tryptophan/tyrosine transport system substrate-binding protein
VKRRTFITLLGGAAAWPLAARAQQGAVPVIGYLYSGAPETSAPWAAAFRKGLSESGFDEGRNVAIEYRWAHNEPARLPDLAADLVRRRVAVIVAPGITASVLAAKAATTTIPIVFRTGGDPVELGFVASLNRPGGNVTGIGTMSFETESKRLGLLHELLPRAARFAVLINPSDPRAEYLTRELRAAASTIRREIEFFGASNSREIDVAFANLAPKRPDALLVSPQGLFSNRRVQIVTQVTRHAMPAISYVRDFVEIGGLMSYGSSPLDQFRQTGIYAGRVLKGEKPGDMPILRASKFEFVINVQTAKVLGIEIPATLLARADEVIE